MPSRSFLGSSYWHGGSKEVMSPESESGYEPDFTFELWCKAENKKHS